MALKFWLQSMNTTEPWTSGGKVTVVMTDDAVPGFQPITVPCPEITEAEMSAKSSAMPGALLRDITAAICADKLGVPIGTVKR